MARRKTKINFGDVALLAAAAVAGGVAAGAVDKYLPDSMLGKMAPYKDLIAGVGGVALVALAKHPAIKAVGMGMAARAGGDFVAQKFGIGAPVMLGAAPEYYRVSANSSNNSGNFQSGGGLGSHGAGEMVY